MAAILAPFETYQARDVSPWKTWPEALRTFVPKEDIARTVTVTNAALFPIGEDYKELLKESGFPV